MTARAITQEVHHELNVTRKRFVKDCQGIWGLQHFHESRELLQIELRRKSVECSEDESDFALRVGQSEAHPGSDLLRFVMSLWQHQSLQ